MRISQSTEVICKFCKSVIPAHSIFGSTAICEKCGQASKKPTIVNPWIRWVLIGLLGSAIAGSLVYSRHSIFAAINPEYAITHASIDEVMKIHRSCLERADHECLVLVYQRMSAADPQDLRTRANLAFQLTALKRFKDADPIYKSILASGSGTYDLMAFYAMNLTALEQRIEAIKWYEKSLGVNPKLADITQKLASLYVQEKRPSEAVSLLQSFIFRFPESEGLLKGDLSADLDLFESAEPAEKIRLVGIAEGHFGLPLRLGEQKQAEVFLVDTGATIVSLPTSDVEKFWPSFINNPQKSRRSQVWLANGQRLDVNIISIPVIRLGTWEFKNVEAAYCDRCDRLAGMSLLKKLKMETSSQGEFSTLTLTR